MSEEQEMIVDEIRENWTLTLLIKELINNGHWSI